MRSKDDATFAKCLAGDVGNWLRYVWQEKQPPGLVADVTCQLTDPFPDFDASFGGVSYRTVERVFAAFFMEKGIQRIVAFLRKQDEPTGKRSAYVGEPWFPGDFGLIIVTLNAPAGEVREAVRERGRACRPHASWLEVSPEEWEAILCGDGTISGGEDWKWGMWDVFMEWYRKGGVGSLRREDGSPLWIRGERPVAAPSPVEPLVAQPPAAPPVEVVNA